MKNKKGKIKSKGWLDMLTGVETRRPNTLIKEKSNTEFGFFEMRQDKDGEYKMEAVKNGRFDR